MKAFFQELLSTRIYKRSQGRITRQVTFAALVLGLLATLWRMGDMMSEAGPALSIGVPGALFFLGVWVAYRAVNLPSFADFLIAVEAEMNKVSWPTRGELYRSSIVVLVVIFALTAVLFGFDFIWSSTFKALGIF